ncbi:Transposon-like protein with integras and ribonuclease H-like domains [Klebsormidium nitens]|uniref:Transposon-like protein with integras and ribonuclease H-like domains n=1 Tax=Klebsormidium nitens TaxID=105231 RepID=A0A1Y1IUQ1_KLENI|nr:Transposon-like protein with integras and ribonuclease H-like domains [Klebsormidium nitens]|eukprot:GAQ92417.1 Transposon-like protein with integras and ribonuclease H-like domains [Klebsormidium nitens]
MTGVKSSFSTLELLEPGTRAIKFANKRSLEVAGVGTVELRCETPSGERVNLLCEVAYVPGVAENLFSVKKAAAVGAEVVFRGEVCELSMDGEVMLRAEENVEGMSVGPGCGGVKAEAFREEKSSVYEPCITGKQTREPFFKESDSKESTSPGLELVHMDVCGTMPVTSKGGSRYLATFRDDYSKLSVVQPMKRKSDVTAVTESVFARLELQSGKKVKSVETDRTGEYVNEGMTALLGKRRTVQRTSAGHSLEQNGSAERLNRTLEEEHGLC